MCLDGTTLLKAPRRWVRQILTRLYPEKDIPSIKYLGVDQTDVPNQRGAELLRGIGRKGWMGLEESVKANALSFLEMEKVKKYRSTDQRRL